MTTFATSDIPNTITTYEQLATWVSVVLADLYPALAVVESGSSATNVAQSTPIYVTSGQTPQWRNVARLSIPLASDWRAQSHIWMAAQELGSTPVPNEYKAA